ncbi:MAG: hypothetical protein EA379_06090 [Phycisphaerales bacterium]|nr:MAG: hypothetical protein EA379_06090 [Phycisphaerales bacterium]
MPKPRPIAITPALCVAICLGAPAAGARVQDEPPVERALRDNEPRPWKIQFEPAVWYAALGGDLNVRGAGRADAGDLNISDPEANPFGELHFRADDLTFTLSGFGFSVDGRSSALGETHTSVDLASVDATIGHNVWRWNPGNDASDVHLGLHVYAGARMFHMDFEQRIDGQRLTDSDVWVHPIVGGKLEAELTRRFSADLALDAGVMPVSSRESYSVSVIVGFQWRPHDNVGAQIGFRQMFFEVDNDDTKFTGSLGGLIGSLVIRF